MALIKVDPSQTKAAAALIGVLVAVSGITVVRLKPHTVSRAAAQPQAAQSARAARAARVEADRPPNRTRNPFEKPPLLRSASPPGGAESPLHALGGATAVRGLGASTFPRLQWQDALRSDSVEVRPVRPVTTEPLNSVREAEPSADPKQKDAGPTKPSFVLLATVSNGGRFSAVIQCGDSGTRVVEVGDVLDGGYRVVGLNADRAVLTDGRETIVAQRPH